LLQGARTLEEEGNRLAPASVASGVAAYAHSGGYKLAPDQYRELVEALLPQMTAAQVTKHIVDSFEKNDFLVVAQARRGSPQPALNQTQLSQSTKDFIQTMRSTLATSSAASTTTSAPSTPTAAIEFSLKKPAGTIVSEQDLGEGIIKWTLSNRATVYLKSVNTTADQVAFSARRQLGLWHLEQNQIATGRVAMSGVWLSSGLANLDRLSLNRELNDKSISLRTFFGTTESGVSTRSRGEDLPFALAAFHEFATVPKTNPIELTQFIKQLKPNLLPAQLAPEAQFQLEWRKARFGPNPWLDVPSSEQIDSVNSASLAQLHSAVFGDASQMIFAFSGNISVRDLRRLCEQYLANLPSSEPQTATPITPAGQFQIPSEKTGVRWQTTLGNAPRATMTTRYISLGVNDTPANNTIMAAMQSVLSNRLRLTLRQESGLTYSPRASIQASRVPANSLLLTIDVTIAPKDLQATQAAIESTVKSLIQTAPSDQELQAFREAYSESTRQLFTDAASTTEILLNFHWRQINLNEVLAARRSIVLANSQQLQEQFAKLLANAQVSIGVHLPAL
jgi:predicted Zn-dependent peptidase